MKTFVIDFVERNPMHGKLARTIRKTFKARNKWTAESKAWRKCPKGYCLWVTEEAE